MLEIGGHWSRQMETNFVGGSSLWHSHGWWRSYCHLKKCFLYYKKNLCCRMIMTRVLSCKQVSSRLYATKFLHVLLRTPLRKHRDYVSWVIELLVNQLYDENKAISLAAINALDEACDCKVNHDNIVYGSIFYFSIITNH